MSRPRRPPNETVRGEIYEALCDYAMEHNTIPNPHSFYTNVFKALGYTIKWSTFRDHWRDLIIDGLIQIDAKTGSTVIVDAQVVKKSEIPD